MDTARFATSVCIPEEPHLRKRCTSINPMKYKSPRPILAASDTTLGGFEHQHRDEGTPAAVHRNLPYPYP